MTDTFRDEKDSAQLQLEDVTRSAKAYNGVEYTDKDGKAARLKVDLFLVSTLTLYYFVSYLDRTNFANAKVAGLERELGMSGTDYNVAVSVFFVPYILLEYPSTILLKKIGPNVLLPPLVGAWGIVTLCQGFVTSYRPLLGCRVLLGALESGLTPCSVILMSMYIKRFSIQTRIAVFFSMIKLAGAFSGLLAYAITKNLDGKHGHSGWRYIFWLEGGGTVFVALTTFFIIPRSPSTAWWLSPPQRAALLAGLEEDNSAYVEAKDEKNVWEGIQVLYTNPVIPSYLLLNCMTGFFANGLSYFLAPIVSGLGFTSVRAQLMSAPPYAVAFVIALVGAFLGDYFRRRTFVLMFGGLLGTIGFIILYTTSLSSFNVRYGALFLIVGGSGALSASVSAWGVSNCSPHLRRATAISFGFMCSNSVALASVWSFLPSQAPYYTSGSALGIAAACIILTVPGLTDLALVRVNRKREAVMRELPSEVVDKEGPIDDRDIRFRFSY